MGSAEDEFTPLSQLKYGMGKCKVRVRISRLWESFNPKNDISFGLDSILIDDQLHLYVEHKLQAIKAKMGSAEDEFTPLSQLKYGMGKCKVRVRISRLWESFNPKNDISFGLDSILIDDQGKTMQARVHPGDIELFEEQLVEGKVYTLSDFTVDVMREDYMSCSNEWTMYFQRQTVVTEMEGDLDSIPLHSFEFVNFKDLRPRCDDNSLLTGRFIWDRKFDVLGHIVYVGELQEFSKKSRHMEIFNARIRDLRGRDLSVTLYGDIACGFAEDMLEKGLEPSVVAVFAGMRVESTHSVCSTTSSKYYLNLDTPEVQEFRENLRIQQANPVPIKSPAEKLAESWRTIEQIKSLDPEEYDEDTMFLCRVSLLDIDCSSGWCYAGCEFCQKSMGRNPRKYRCSRCGPVKRPVQMYKLKAKVQDATGIMNLMIFCDVVEELVGVSAEELVDEIEDDDDWYTLPEEIEDLLGSTHTFQVFDKYGCRSFSVNSIMDHVSVPVPFAAASTTQPKEEPDLEDSVRLAPTTIKCKEEPDLDDSVSLTPTPTTTKCKEEPDLEDRVSLTPTMTKCKEDPDLDDSVSLTLSLAPTTTQCKEESVPEGIAPTAEARSKTVTLQKPAKRLRGDDWMN